MHIAKNQADRIVAVEKRAMMGCFSIFAVFCWHCCDGGVFSTPRIMSYISDCMNADVLTLFLLA
jgi:hypothetical protein